MKKIFALVLALAMTLALVACGGGDDGTVDQSSGEKVVKIGVNDEGRDVYIDRFAAEADGIIVNCRVKPHSAFRGKYESGIMKMMAIGLGKQYGAEVCHNEGIGDMAKNIPLFGRCILARRNAISQPVFSLMKSLSSG